MDPISLMSSSASLLGMGIQAFGMFGAAHTANQIAGTQQQILGQEEQENAQRQQAMVLSAQRMQVQNLRNTQRARAMGLAAATNQGAQFGSGLAGGQAQASAQGAYNELGVSQNLQIGKNIFGIDQTIGNLKMGLAGEESTMAKYQGMMGLGGGLAQAGGPLGKLFGNFLPGGGRSSGTDSTYSNYGFNFT